MNTLPDNLVNMGILDAGAAALLGYAVVFLGLIALMIVVIILGKCFSARKKPAEKAAPAPTPAPTPAAAPVQQVVQNSLDPVNTDAAPGTAGKLKLHDVSPKTAAMLMAIVANKMNKPLNELRFISIKEVK